MSSPAFGDYVFTTLSRARNSADGSPLSLQQKSDVAAYLRSSGSGPEAVTSIESIYPRRCNPRLLNSP